MFLLRFGLLGFVLLINLLPFLQIRSQTISLRLNHSGFTLFSDENVLGFEISVVDILIEEVVASLG